ncbi:unnamed protein product [Sphagnum balticum]
MAMGQQDEKTKRMRELLSSFYGTGSPESDTPTGYGRRDTLQGINLPNFDVDHYMESLLHNTPLDRLLQRHVEVAAEIKNLDSDMQMLVYENYNKFISATDTIRRMKENVAGMESNMEHLLDTVTMVRAKSDGINASLCERRERIEQLNGTRSLLRKIQFIFDLPQRLRKCMNAEDYSTAVKYYKGALPILQAYGQSSFRSCKEEVDELISTLTDKLQTQVMDQAVQLSSRARAVTLLQQLNHSVDSMVERFMTAHWDCLLGNFAAFGAGKPETNDPLTVGFYPQHGLKALDTTTDVQKRLVEKDLIQDFIETAGTFRTLFPSYEIRLIEAATKLFDESVPSYCACMLMSSQFVGAGVLISDITRMDELVPEASLPERASKALEDAVRQHVATKFSRLSDQIKAAIVEEPSSIHGATADVSRPLKASLDRAQATIIQGSLDVLQDLKLLLDNSKEYLLRWRDEYIDLVQGGFQDLFTNLVDHFLSLCLKSGFDSASASPDKLPEATPSLVLLLALLSVYIYQTAVPQITEVVGTCFVGGGVMGYEARPAFVPSEICRFFHSTAERLLQQYVDVQAQKLSVLVRKSVETPNWLKYKEPRDVRMFADLLLQEVEILEGEVQQLLDPGSTRTHRHTDSSGSIGSSRSASTREDGYSGASHRSNMSHRARNQLLERDVAKLFTERVEIFTKLEFNQASVVSTVVKMTLKSFQECVRLQTFNRSGYQQIQLDMHYLRDPLHNLLDNETVVDFLLDEVCLAAAERCLDAVPLEMAILDKLVQAKLAKKESSKSTSHK